MNEYSVYLKSTHQLIMTAIAQSTEQAEELLFDEGYAEDEVLIDFLHEADDDEYEPRLINC